MSRKKISFFGAGNVGGIASFICAIKEFGDIVLIDTPQNHGVALGKAIDIKQSLSLFNSDISITGSSDPCLISNSDICVILAGFPRKPGMSRDDLFTTNHSVIESISSSIKKYAPDSIIIMVTNPLDALTFDFLKLSGFPKNRVMGMAGILDSVRFQSYLADHINCSTRDIRSLVLGSHGDEMIPINRYSTVNGIPVKEFIDDDIINQSIQKVRDSGGEFVKMMGTSAYFAAGSSVAVIIESIVRDQKRILPCSVYLSGEYGIYDSCIGVPVMIGKNGVEKIMSIQLSENEIRKLQESAEAVKKMVSVSIC